MYSKATNEQIEIILEFIQETRDMVEQLEPTIIALEQSGKRVNCWEVKECDDAECERFNKEVNLPCWLHKGFIDAGAKTCVFGESKLDCINCEAFQAINGDPETINAIFRLFHSMKGSAGFLELEHIQKVAHSAENLLDLIRSGSVLLDTAHVTILCEACDFTKDALDYINENYDDDGMADEADVMAKKLFDATSEATLKIEEYRKELGLETEEIEEASAQKDEDTVSEETAERTESFELSEDMQGRFVVEADELLGEFEHGLLNWIKAIDDLDIVSELFRNIHSFKGDCGFFNYADLEKLSHKMETLLAAAKAKAGVDKHKSAKVLLELVDVLRIALVDISNSGRGNINNVDIYIDLLEGYLPKGWVSEAGEPEEKAVPVLGDILVEQGVISQKEVEKALAEQRRPFGEVLVDKGVISKDEVKNALKKQEDIRKKLPPKAKEKIKPAVQAVVKRQDIRVDLSKLDNLINLIGELVIAENVVVHNPDLKGLHLENFNKSAQQMNKLIRELQEMAMVIRMIPVTGLFRRMIRLVHDLSVKSGKKVELKLVGEETELDKTVIETITDPLVHIIRNSLDHGLETPEGRKEAGKSETGCVTLSAMHEEGEIWITIEDDGQGLDRDAIIEKALSKGLIDGDGSDVSDSEIYNMIFLPGFSTAKKVTDVSGRGVGMDVVNQNLKKINGKVKVVSKKGCGTKIVLRIPLTLAIIEGMLIRVGETKCILPILSIKENFKPAPDQITISPEGQEIVRVREKFFPILRLHNILRLRKNGSRFDEGIMILVEAHGKKICLFADELLGQQQTVIKGLSNYIGNIKGISGCTILGNGEVSLILDAGSLIENR